MQLAGITEGLSGVYDNSELFLRVVPVGVLEQVCARFTTLERLRSGRSADPSAAIIDSQSVPTVEAGSEECGDDAGKTIKGGKRVADGAYGGDKLASALKKANCPITVEVIGKPRDTKGFVVMSRRWVAERTFGWLRRCRRLSRDFERSIASALAWLLLALSRVLMRRLGRMKVTVTN